MKSEKQPKQSAFLLTVFAALILTGCQPRQDHVVATYSDNSLGKSEKIQLLSTGKYVQTLSYYHHASGADILFRKPENAPVFLYAKGAWTLIDLNTKRSIDVSKYASGAMKQTGQDHAEVELKSAIDTAPFSEGRTQYAYADRSLPASAFHLTEKTPAK